MDVIATEKGTGRRLVVENYHTLAGAKRVVKRLAKATKLHDRDTGETMTDFEISIEPGRGDTVED
jgi:hypothetical protein